MKRIAPVAVIAALLVLSTSPAQATSYDGYSYGIGVQMLPGTIDGISFTWDMTSKVAVNPMIDLGFDAFGGEIRYAFMQKSSYDLFAGPMVATGGSNVDFGAAAGVDWDWRSLDSGLPPISWNLQLGFAVDAGFGVGVGIHYSFGR